MPLRLLRHACRALRAALKYARACYLCPEDPVFDRNIWPPWYAYQPAFEHAAAPRQPHAELAASLMLYWRALANAAAFSDHSGQQRLALAQQAADSLQQPAQRAAISQQLTQLAADGEDSHQALSMPQLEGALLRLVIKCGYNVVQGFTPQQLLQAADHGATLAVYAAATVWQHLEPGSPLANEQLATASVAVANDAETPEAALSNVPHLLRAMQLAQQQHSPLMTAHCALAAVWAAILATRLDAATLQALLNAFQLAEQAIEACRRLLPRPWVEKIQRSLEMCSAAVPVLQAQLRGSGPTLDRAHMQNISQRVEHDMHAAVIRSTCAGCNKTAVGLRACARCKAAFYCSRECQAKAWPQHKRECRPA